MSAAMLLSLKIVDRTGFVHHSKSDGSFKFSPTHHLLAPKLLRAFVTLPNSLLKHGKDIFIPPIKETTFLFLKQKSCVFLTSSSWSFIRSFILFIVIKVQ